MSEITTISKNKCHGGVQGFYSHESTVCNGTMRFAVYEPPQALAGESRPLLTYLSGLTCTEENFVIKAGAQRLASELGLFIVAPDTSPRGQDIPGEDDSYDFGSAAGFYLNATQEPWSKAYNMYSYVVEELPAVIAAGFPKADFDRQGVFGHSMGGHGALTIALKNPERYRSVSAFSPIVAPMQVPWGTKAFTGYLGDDQETWRAYDSVELIKAGRKTSKILVDQGDADDFLAEQLRPELLKEACESGGQALELRLQPGYDHSYYFIQTFMDDHLRHHAAQLGA